MFCLLNTVTHYISVKKESPLPVILQNFSEQMVCRTFQSSSPGLFLRKEVMKICRQFAGEHPFWRNHTLAWVFSCTFTAYFQNIFFHDHLWRTTSDISDQVLLPWEKIEPRFFVVVGLGVFSCYVWNRLNHYQGKMCKFMQ